MKINKYDSREDWLFARRGKITGSRLKNVAGAFVATKDVIAKELSSVGISFDPKAKKEEIENLLPLTSKIKLMLQGEKKIGFYELIAERLATEPEGDETPMDRGTRLEPEAMELFKQKTGKKIDDSLVIWTRDDNESIAISPDGFIGKKEAVEIKCLSSAKHIEALLTQKVPDEYEMQVIQYFVVNEDLQTLYFVFYDPRIPGHEMFHLEITRESVQAEVDTYLEYQRQTLKEVDEITLKLSNF